MQLPELSIVGKKHLRVVGKVEPVNSPPAGDYTPIKAMSSSNDQT